MKIFEELKMPARYEIQNIILENIPNDDVNKFQRLTDKLWEKRRDYQMQK